MNPSMTISAVAGTSKSTVSHFTSSSGAPLELVKCETVDLEVPATAEIVIEGFIPPYERQKEGPFGDAVAGPAGERAPRPVYHVTAITHRDRPLLPVALDDLAIALSITRAAEILT